MFLLFMEHVSCNCVEALSPQQSMGPNIWQMCLFGCVHLQGWRWAVWRRHHHMWIPSATFLHTRLCTTRSACGPGHTICNSGKCLDLMTPSLRCAPSLRCPVTCSLRRGGTGGITRLQNNSLSLHHITTGHMRKCSMVSATTRHRSAGPGLGHTQKTVRCDGTHVADTMLVALKLYR